MRGGFLSAPRIAVILAGLALAACAGEQGSRMGAAPPPAGTGQAATSQATASQAVAPAEKFEADRQAILAMSGEYRVSFNFIETVAYAEGYEPKPPKESGGFEVVRVIRDDGDFISLQHLLVVGEGENQMVVKHWRQDWQYEPERVFRFVGGNAWRMVDTDPEAVDGKWSQSVYQVDDAPRYAAIAAWEHDNGVSEWTSPRAWRPLPRRDATTRDDYDVIAGINRHAITPYGWVHEQDNTKLELRGESQALVRETAFNVYRAYNDFDYRLADEYWAETADYWAAVRDEWERLERRTDAFGLTIQGEPAELYFKLLEDADAVAKGEMTTAAAAASARETIDDYTTTDIGSLAARIAKRRPLEDAGQAAGDSTE